MADLDDKTEPSRQFVRERVLDKKGRKKRGLKWITGCILAGIIIGVIACLVFVCFRPLFERLFYHETEAEAVIEIPRDETEAEAEETTAPVETAAAETEPAVETPAEIRSDAQIEDIAIAAVESYEWKIEDYTSLYGTVSDLASTVNKGIVTVTNKTSTTDWFDNTIETEGQTSGIIWNTTTTELLILTKKSDLSRESKAEVTFYTGDVVAAHVKSVDSSTGLAILGVYLAQLPQNLNEKVEVISLGNSYSVKTGTPVVIAGSPANYVGSVDYGIISYVQRDVMREDMEVQYLYTNVCTDSKADGFVLNLEGQLIGVILDGMTGDKTGCIGISDLKAILEIMSNYKSIPSLGVIGKTVTTEISEAYEIPVGVYVDEAVINGPAFESGIQSGDIIISVNGEDVKTVRALQQKLEGSDVGDVLTIRLMRAEQNTYKEMTVKTTLGSR